LELLTGIVAALQVIVSLLLIFLILLHAGRGGGMSDMFGGGIGGGGAVSGSTVMERNLDRVTVAAAVVFAVSTFALDMLLR
jgi:preprotein translocase subunit SecG